MLDDTGKEYVNSVWDILSGDLQPKNNVVIIDYNGGHSALSCAEYICTKNKECSLEFITPDRAIGEDMGNTNFPIHLRNMYNLGITMTPDHSLYKVTRNDENDDSEYICYIKNEYNDKIEKRYVDQIIVEYGTLPENELFNELKSESINNGEIDVNALVNGKSPFLNINKNINGQYYLIRIGDSVVSRNIHAAVFDSLRYCKDI